MARQRRSFSTEFKREAAGLVLDQGYSMAEACRSLDVGELVPQNPDDEPASALLERIQGGQ